MQTLYSILGIFICAGAITVLSLPDENIEIRNIHPRALEHTINSTVEFVRPNISNPLEILGAFPLSFNDTLLSGTLELFDPNIYGLNGILIPYLNFDLFTSVLYFEFVFPQLRVENLLNTDINIFGVLPIFGNDTSSIIINNLQIKGHTGVVLTPLSLQDLFLEIHLENIKLELHGLLNDENFSVFASDLLTLLGNDLVVSALNNDAKAIGESISPGIEDTINNIIAGNSTNTTSEFDWIVTSFATTLTEKLNEEFSYE